MEHQKEMEKSLKSHFSQVSSGLEHLGTYVRPWNIVPEGQGIMKDPDGRLYEGQYQFGDAHGRGFAFSLDQSKYEGPGKK